MKAHARVAEPDSSRPVLPLFCDSPQDDAAGADRTITPFGVAYGNYIRNSTKSSNVTCPCGPAYRTFAIDVNANGVPYDGKNLNNLNVIWRVTPGSGAWQYGPSLGITTYGSLPTVSGTMSTSSYVTSVAAVYHKGQTLLESIQAVAP